MTTKQTMPSGMPRTDALFLQLCESFPAECSFDRHGRIQLALFKLCIQLEQELTGLPLTPTGTELMKA